MCDICSKLSIKSPQRRRWGCSGVSIIGFEQVLPAEKNFEHNTQGNEDEKTILQAQLKISKEVWKNFKVE